MRAIWLPCTSRSWLGVLTGVLVAALRQAGLMTNALDDLLTSGLANAGRSN